MRSFSAKILPCLNLYNRYNLVDHQLVCCGSYTSMLIQTQCKPNKYIQAKRVNGDGQALAPAKHRFKLHGDMSSASGEFDNLVMEVLNSFISTCRTIEVTVMCVLGFVREVDHGTWKRYDTMLCSVNRLNRHQETQFVVLQTFVTSAGSLIPFFTVT